jgi:hypothetical protein
MCCDTRRATKAVVRRRPVFAWPPRSVEMRLTLLLLSSFAVGGQAQTFADHPLRKVGTNVYDFTSLIRQLQRDSTTETPFLVIGRVVSTAVNHIEIERKTGSRFEVRSPKASWSRDAGSGDLLVMASALRMSGSNGISAGQYMSFSPQMRQYFEPASDYIRVNVTNAPGHLTRGMQVQLLALPISGGRFDYGEPFSGDPKDFNTFLVTAQGFVRKERPAEAASKTAAATARLIAYQHEQASNGVARVQYDLAKRYFAGEGVAKDELLGRYWLRCSAAQDYEPALKLQETLTGQK